MRNVLIFGHNMTRGENYQVVNGPNIENMLLHYLFGSTVYFLLIIQLKKIYSRIWNK